jgi:hypothetical protein
VVTVRHYPPRPARHPKATGWSPDRDPAAHARFARAVKAYAGNRCQLCGATTRLAAHHRNGDVTDNRTENGLLVCVDCHKELDPYAR